VLKIAKETEVRSKRMSSLERQNPYHYRMKKKKENQKRHPPSENGS